ncbi:MAG: hypothetical protein MJ158_03855 [Alphaproteobacteria bacterium]|nr:hypothetical protein [Alphaproteobacteria bacterium]
MYHVKYKQLVESGDRIAIRQEIEKSIATFAEWNRIDDRAVELCISLYKECKQKGTDPYDKDTIWRLIRCKPRLSWKMLEYIVEDLEPLLTEEGMQKAQAEVAEKEKLLKKRYAENRKNAIERKKIEAIEKAKAEIEAETLRKQNDKKRSKAISLLEQAEQTLPEQDGIAWIRANIKQTIMNLRRYTK